jgi:ADP-ribosylglycohydrolase
MGSLEDKVFGCLAASQIGSAMGAPCEGWDWQRVEKTHGRIEGLLPYEHYDNGWMREAGTTEDGIERQRVFLRAIRRAGGRIRPDDVAAVWREEVDGEHAAWCMEPFDRFLIGLARADVPAVRIGSFSPYTNLISLARSCHPLGLINAGDPEQAWRDVHYVGLVLQAPTGIGMDWAGLVAGTIAAACSPGATLESALEAGLAPVGPHLRREVERAVEVAAKADDMPSMREAFEHIYAGYGIPYGMAYANEITSKGIAVASKFGSSLRDTLIAAVNFGRDTDCLAAISGGIAGAVNGPADLPEEWIAQVDHATANNPHTCLRLTLAQMAGIVTDGLRAEMKRAGERAAALRQAFGE